jgi:hypothetical protein
VPILDRSPVAARQLASRARRRVQSKAPSSDSDLHQQRRVVEAFLAAVHEGDFERLVAVLDPDIVLRADGGALAAASRACEGSCRRRTGLDVLEARSVQSACFEGVPTPSMKQFDRSITYGIVSVCPAGAHGGQVVGQKISFSSISRKQSAAVSPR